MDILIYYFKTYQTVRYSAIVLALVSLCAALLGVSLVLKRLSMIGDGLSHVAFGATSIASVTAFTPMYVAMPVTMLAAVFLLRTKPDSKTRGDASIAMISVGALAIGYMVMNLFPSKSSAVSGDACTALFGSASIIGISTSDVIVCAVTAVIVLFIFIFFYNRIFAITFDESFSKATGVASGFYNTLLAITTGAVIVIAMSMVGALLISALITFPALSAMKLFKTFKSVMICSAVTSVICSLAGTAVCILASTPVGPTIAVANIIVFIVFSLISRGKTLSKV